VSHMVSLGLVAAALLFVAVGLLSNSEAALLTSVSGSAFVG